jgi:iodotyrosine deiodinase
MEKGFIDYQWTKLNPEQHIDKSRELFEEMNKRRSIREFSDEAVPEEALINAIKTASTAPSGANKQPWTFCLVSSPEVKREIRLAAEEEEKLNYSERMSEEWLKDLEQFGTNWQKPFLEIAPYLIVVFKKAYDDDGEGKKTNYYVNESVGLATGFLLMALHQIGLYTLTHTPSPLKFLTKILDRPGNERPFLLIPVGYPADGHKVPDIQRKTLDQIMTTYR